MSSYNGNYRNFMIERKNAQKRKLDSFNNTCQTMDPCHEQESRHHSDPCHEHESCHNSSPCHKQESCHMQPKWSALDPTMNHPFGDATVEQVQDDKLENLQQSIESIVIKDSCDVEVSSTDTQVALNIQVALQVAIALVISISIADSSKTDSITQDLNAKLKSSQINKQQVYIENSRGVTVSTTDTDIAVNVQILLQVLIALVVRLDVL